MNIKKMLSVLAICSAMMGFAGISHADAEEAQADVPESRIVINTASRGLYFYNHGVKTRLYPIAIGSPSTPTPVGYFKIIEMEVNPTWTDPKTGKSIESGPYNPLGYRWMRIYGNYGIHGTNNESSIGSYVSNGCIRMFERDVEELFELVDMGTPVDIMYNRVVVEKADDDTVVYYIYPDGYGWQPLKTEDVSTWLQGFGVDAFVSDDDIKKKISDSDGQPTFIAKAYELRVNGKSLEKKIVIKDGVVYLPAIPVAEAVGTYLNNNNGVLVSQYGKAAACIFKNQIFINADDAEVLFSLQGGMNNGVYTMNTVERKRLTDYSPSDRHHWAGNNDSTTVINRTENANTDAYAKVEGQPSESVSEVQSGVKAADSKVEADGMVIKVEVDTI